jgi:NADH-quinone oxidoreductase subunit M
VTVTDFPWLTTLGLVPLAGAAVVALLPKGRDLLAKQVALAVSLLTLVLTVVMALQFDPAGPDFQFIESHEWIPAFGVSYSVGVDGIALVLIALATTLVPIVILAGWNDAEGGRRSVKMFFALILSLETMMVGVFASTDVVLFYVFFEAMLLPAYCLIGSYGGAQRSYAAVKFLLYSLFGGLLMLASLIGLYVVSARQSPDGQGTFDFFALTNLGMDEGTQKMLFLGFFFAFAIKAPLWPFHTWLPDAATEGTPGTAVLLVGVLDKVGTFGMLRYLLPIFPDASKFYTPIVLAIALIGIIYGALVAIGQTDMKRLIAYTSISHFGFITMGIFAMTSQGLSGSTLYMVNHGVSTAALFLIAGFLISRRGSKYVDAYGGVQKVAPLLAGTFFIAGLSSLALPGMASFVSEFLVLVGTFTRYPWVAVIATLGIVLAALYILIMIQKVNTGPITEGVRGFKDLGGREMLVAVPLVALFIVMGFFPKPLLDVINPATDTTLQYVQQTDPPATVGAPEPGAAAEGTNP